ncbi:GIY-YIG nuclease family protein [candidate division KSB1 bacterium]
MNKYFLYILASKRNGTLYTGVTNDLKRRIYEHKNGLIEGFTKKYKVDKLVYFEEFNIINDALLREKNIKTWKRAWKIRHIEEFNPEWNDLYNELV